jgi:hypothetical protein
MVVRSGVSLQRNAEETSGMLDKTLLSDDTVRVLAESGPVCKVRCVDGTEGWTVRDALLPLGAHRSADFAAVTAPTTSSRLPASSGLVGPRTLLAFLGGIGVMIGALADWSRGGSANSFKVPVSSLFDWKSQNQDPKLGYFLIGIAVLCLMLAFVKANGAVLVLSGLAAVAASLLYMVQLNSAGHAYGGSASFTEFVGPGAWILGISGLVLLISPLVALAEPRTAFGGHRI